MKLFEKEFLGKRLIREGSNMGLTVAFVIGIIVIFNILSSFYHYRFDVTPEKLYTLSDQTLTLLRTLEEPVKATGFYREGTQGNARDLLKSYAYNARRFSYEFVDFDKNPVRAQEYDERLPYRSIIVECDDKRERINEETEEALTNAIMKVTREQDKKIYFIGGHGERAPRVIAEDGYSLVRDRLKAMNYVLNDSLVLARESIPEDCDVLVVIRPKVLFQDIEIEMIKTYLENGNNALFAFDPGYTSGLEGMLSAWAFWIGNDFVIDRSGMGMLFGLTELVPVVMEYGVHKVTEKHERMMTYYPLARSVALDPNRGNDIRGRELVKTSSNSWAEIDLSPLRGESKEWEFDPDSGDKQGPIPIAAAVEAEPRNAEASGKTRIVVFGDSDFASNKDFLNQGNGDLLLNAISWLAEQEDLITIRPRKAGHNPISLTKRDGKVLFWLSVILFPLAVLAGGGIVWWRRR